MPFYKSTRKLQTEIWIGEPLHQYSFHFMIGQIELLDRNIKLAMREWEAWILCIETVRGRLLICTLSRLPDNSI